MFKEPTPVIHYENENPLHRSTSLNSLNHARFQEFKTLNPYKSTEQLTPSFIMEHRMPSYTQHSGTMTPSLTFGGLYKENQFSSQPYGGSVFMQPLSSPRQAMQHFSQPFPNFYGQQGQMTPKQSSPVKGKWSVNSQFLQSNHFAVIDRVKEILLKSSNDT
mgnify:CR=1 FL=1